MIPDEKGKIPLARRGCLLIIIGSGLGASRVPQNLGRRQKVEDHPTILGFHAQPRGESDEGIASPLATVSLSARLCGIRVNCPVIVCLRPKASLTHL